jgi:hypothetical protein
LDTDFRHFATKIELPIIEIRFCGFIDGGWWIGAVRAFKPSYQKLSGAEVNFSAQTKKDAPQAVACGALDDAESG